MAPFSEQSGVSFWGGYRVAQMYPNHCRLVLPLFQESRVYFEGGYRMVQVYLLAELGARHEIPGPAIVMDSLSTILVEPGK